MISTIATPRHLRIVGLACGAVALAGTAIYVTASAAGYNLGFKSPSGQPATTSLAASTGSPSAICSDFISHFSSDLGTTQSKVNTAFQQAMTQTLADEVKNGTLTQAQADKIQKKVTATPPCSLASGLGKAPSPSTGARYQQELMTAAASALGISQQQLKTDLANGQSLSQIAAAQTPPVTEDQFRARLIAALKPLLDQAVTAKTLTTAQEQTILQKLQTGTIPFWSTPMRPAAGATATN